MSIRDPFTERFSSLPSKPLNLFAVPKSITSVFPFLRLMISSLSRNQEARLLMSSLYFRTGVRVSFIIFSEGQGTKLVLPLTGDRCVSNFHVFLFFQEYKL